MHSNSVIEVGICNPSAFLYSSKIRLSFDPKRNKETFRKQCLKKVVDGNPPKLETMNKKP